MMRATRNNIVDASCIISVDISFLKGTPAAPVGCCIQGKRKIKLLFMIPNIHLVKHTNYFVP